MTFIRCFLLLLLGWTTDGFAREPSSIDQKLSSPDYVRIYRSPEERREAGLGSQITEWLRFGGVVEIEKEWQKNVIKGRDNTADPDPELAIELGFEVDYHDWLEAEILFAIEDNGRRHYQELDEGLIGVDLGNLGIKLGRLYVPFGVYYTHFVSNPILEFGQTRGDAILMDYTWEDTLEFAAYVFDSKVDQHENHNEVDWGVNLEYVSEDESMRFGVGYLSDLAESQDELLFDFNNNFLRRVPAWNVYGMVGLPPFELTGEVLRAIRPFKEFPINADQPFAYNIELAYFPVNFFQVAIRLEHSERFEGNPEWQYGVSGTWAPWNNFTLSADYLYGRYKKGLALDDFDNTQISHHFTVLQLTWGF